MLQVTSSSVRLVSSISRELRHEWHAPNGFSINVATANASQVIKFYLNICLIPCFVVMLYKILVL